MNQTDIFLKSEGDAWFARNREQLGLRDPVSEVIEGYGLTPISVLEVGCSNGWRLHRLVERHGCRIRGIEPSAEATENARLPRTIFRACANDIPFDDGEFDIVIFGFCLYLCEPKDLFRIAAEADRVLRDMGHLIIHDFDHEGPPFARLYKHNRLVLSYHMDFSRLWGAHPFYRNVYTQRFRENETDELVTVMQKNVDAIPVKP